MKFLITACLSVCLLSGSGPAGQPDKAKRPKLGVALAGGAALGLAHIGVIQWLEEHRIPIDYIGGTSMGGLVGGLHAVGLSSAEIIDFVNRVDWGLALSPTAPYKDLAFRRKEDLATFPVTFEIGLKHGQMQLPSGLSAGQGVGLVINRAAAPYGSLRSFDDLPTPFRCVASDLTSGKGVIFDKGSLFDAMRATMSLPALFSPLRLNGMTLVDGALTNNLPVDVVKNMGADYTIAVALDVPVDPKDFQSLLGVAGRSISYMISENERPQIASADLVLMPSLKGMTASDYSRSEEFRKIGYEAAARKAGMLEKFQVSEAEYKEYVAARQAKRLPHEIRPQEIRIAGDVAPKLQASLKNAIMPPAGEALNDRILEEQMLKLTGMGRFETASYQFVREQNREILNIQATERPNGPPFIKPAVLIDGASGEGIRFGIGARLTFLDIGGPASEWRTDAAIGTYNVLGSEYYYRLQGGKWFVAPRVTFIKNQLPMYDSWGNHTADYDKSEFAGGADVGYAFGRAQELRLGYEIGHLSTNLDTGTNSLYNLSGQFGAARARFRRDTRNGPLVPTRGTYLELRGSWYDRYPNVSRGFAAFEGTVQHAHSFNRKYSIALNFAAGNSVEESSLRNLFDLGGYARMSSLSRNQLLGNNYYIGSAYLRRTLSVDTISMFGRFYGVIGYEVGRAWFPGSTATPRHAGVIGITGATRIGVVFFGGSIGDQGAMKLLFRLGRAY